MASLALHPTPVFGQEPGVAESAEEDDGPYADLRKSENRTTQLLVDRYENLTKLQEWRDLSGKSRIMARYVEHDPELRWVKLAVVKGSGAKRVVKEGSVPVAKLNKTAQSRVRQIDTLQKKLDELRRADPDGDGPLTASDLGSPMTDEAGVEPGTPREGDAFAVPQGDPNAVPGAPPSAADAPFEVDPLGFAEMDLTPPAPPGGGPEGPFAIPTGGPGELPVPPTDERQK